MPQIQRMEQILIAKVASTFAGFALGAGMTGQYQAPLASDHDDFGSNRSEIMNVIDSNKLEHDVVRKPFPLFGIML